MYNSTEFVCVKFEFKSTSKNAVGLQSLEAVTRIPYSYDYIADAIDTFMCGLGETAYLYETRSAVTEKEPYSELKQRVQQGIKRHFDNSISTKYCTVFNNTIISGSTKVDLKISLKYA